MKRRTLWLLLAVMSIPALCFAPAVQTARAEDPHIGLFIKGSGRGV